MDDPRRKSGAREKTEREQRLSRALRDNLLRRKAQARAKAEGGSGTGPAENNSPKGKRSG